MYRNYWATVLFGVLLASCGGDETVVIGGESNEGDAETESDTGGAGIPGDVSNVQPCLLYTSPSPRDATLSRMPSSA